MQEIESNKQQHVTVIRRLAAGVYEKDTLSTIWREEIGDTAVRGIQKFAQVYNYLGDLVSGTSRRLKTNSTQNAKVMVIGCANPPITEEKRAISNEL
jgi:hypothetical protein